MTEPIDSVWRPDFGGMRHTFRFDPLHYGVGGGRQAAFKDRMRSELRQYGFILTGEVAVTWHLQVDQQARWESDVGADVDNFAKLLDDGLCGPDGILIDDVQVQSLQVYWTTAWGDPQFELTVHCQPDEYLPRPVSLYELADGLWHPLPDSIYETPDGAARLLHVLDDRVLHVRHLRHHLRQRGLPQRAAYQAAAKFGVLSRGFHGTRAAASGVPRVRRAAWQAEFARPSDLPPPVDADIERIADAISKSGRG